MLQRFPEIEAITQLSIDTLHQVKILKGVDDFSFTGVAAGVELFDVFQMSFLKGSPATSFAEPNAIVLTESSAARLFGEANPMGKIVSIKWDGIDPAPVVVTGVVADLPGTTHLVGDYFYRLDWQYSLESESSSSNAEYWDTWLRTYVKIKNGASIRTIDDSMTEFVASVTPDHVFAEKEITFHFVALEDIYFHGTRLLALKPGGDIRLVNGFAGVALIILFVSCFNFSNMILSINAARRRESALRLVVGAGRARLSLYFLLEAAALTLIALLLSMEAVNLALPAINTALATTIAADSFGTPAAWITLLLFWACLFVMSGLIPAYKIYKTRHLTDLLEPRHTRTQGRFFQSTILTSQLSIVLILIPVIWTIYAQTQHAMNDDQGFRKEGLLAIRGMVSEEIKPHVERVIQEIKALPDVSAAARSLEAPGDDLEFTLDVRHEGYDGQIIQSTLVGSMVGFGFFEIYDIRPVVGRTFSPEYQFDKFLGQAGYEWNKLGSQTNLIVNMSAIKTMGFSSPEEAVGKVVHVNMGDGSDATIIGVIPDVSFTSLKKEVGPEAYAVIEGALSNLTIAFDTNNYGAFIAELEKIWRDTEASGPLDYVLVNENWNKAYASDVKLGKIFAAFAILTLLISLGGLYAFVLFDVQKRVREIAVRRVFGGTRGDIARLLLFRYSKSVFWSAVIAMPFSWFIAQRWLQDYTDRIELEVLFFVVPIFVTLLLVWGVSFRLVMQIANTSPAQVLQCE
jgi:putative ABC transport system permease protein